MSQEQKVLRFRLVTDSRWMVASVRTNLRHLIQLLNEDRQTLEAERVELQGDVYAYRGITPATARIWIGRAVLVMPLDEGDGHDAETGDSSGRRVGELVRLGVGRYEVVGNLSLPEGTTLEDCLAGGCERFVAVNRASVRRTDGVGPVYRQSTVLVNREYLEYAMAAPSLPLFEGDFGHALLD